MDVDRSLRESEQGNIDTVRFQKANNNKYLLPPKKAQSNTQRDGIRRDAEKNCHWSPRV